MHFHAADVTDVLLTGIHRCMPIARTRSEGFSFTLGVWGLGCVRSTQLSRRNSAATLPQPLATVRNRSQPSSTVCDEVPVAVPIESAARVVTFGGFKGRPTSFRLAGVALCDSPKCFIRCQKPICVTGAKLLHRFQMLTFFFGGRRSAFEMSIFILRGRAAL